MEWIVEPMNNFKNLIPVILEDCPNTWYQCSCTGGLNVCDGGPKSLVVQK